jgi:hypothetical protein
MCKYLLVLTLVLPVEQIEKELRKQKVEEVDIEKIKQRYCKFVNNVDKICKGLKEKEINGVDQKNQDQAVHK